MTALKINLGPDDQNLDDPNNENVCFDDVVLLDYEMKK